jgi:hypothetical protein
VISWGVGSLLPAPAVAVYESGHRPHLMCRVVQIISAFCIYIIIYAHSSGKFRSKFTRTESEWLDASACRVFVGTVSEFCVKHAECPVITIKRNANEVPQDPADD